MIYEFLGWSAPRAEISTFADFENTTLAIEAHLYLEHLLTQPRLKEPLLSALGGLPFAINAHIRNEINALKDSRITPIFVFSGLEAGKRVAPFEKHSEAAHANGNAWDLYNQHLAEKAVDTFGKSGYAQPEDFYRLLQVILKELDVDFQVAPYSAWGQLAYLNKFGTAYVDAIAGSSETLLFDVDRLITKLDFERKEFTFVRRQNLVEELGGVTPDMFVDACMLSGNAMLPPLPQLRNGTPRRAHRVGNAVDLMKGLGQTGISVCMNYQDDQAVKSQNYLDRYRRSRLAIKHQVVLTAAGKVEPFDPENLSYDAHEFLGQRLPEELYYYLSIGVIGPHILNQLTSGVVYETTPVDGGNSDAYKALVRDKLFPIKSRALSLISRSLTRAYSHREVKLSCWFAEEGASVRLSDTPRPDEVLDKWNVPSDTLNVLDWYKSGNVTLSNTLQALKDTSFASKTITKKAKDSPRLLESKGEVIANTMWRFLHLRAYVDDKHTLTKWGEVLNSTLAALKPEFDLHEGAVLAVELLRLDVLSSDNMFTTYTGSPLRGNDTDKRNCMLLSRIACLGKLRHQSIGFTGPLSRQLLGYTSIINATRSTLRDLMETTLTTLLLNGDAERDRSDLTEIALELPFLLQSDCALGIAMKHYLDDLPSFEDPTAQRTRDAVKQKGSKEWFQYAEDFAGDLERAFCLWDAIYAGVKTACKLSVMEGQGKWDAVDEWVRNRR